MGYWTEETVAKLRELHAEGLSASQIAAEMPPTRLGDAPTRNTIIGKLQRLKLFYNGPAELRSKVRTREGVIGPVNPTKRKRSKSANRSEAEKTLAKWREANPKIASAWAGFDGMPTDVPHGSEAILGLRNGLCCFPIGDPHVDDFRYCCAPSGVKPYCAHHMAIAYVPTKPRVKKKDTWHIGRREHQSANRAIFDRASYSKPLLDAPYRGASKGRGLVYDGV